MSGISTGFQSGVPPSSRRLARGWVQSSFALKQWQNGGRFVAYGRKCTRRQTQLAMLSMDSQAGAERGHPLPSPDRPRVRAGQQRAL